jgi:outer membrane assembly lipoprotein YfiO
VRWALVILAALAMLMIAAPPVQAGWVWRGGRWVYIDETLPPLPPPREQPKPEPVPPKPEPKPPAPEAKPPAPEARPPAPEAKPPATGPKPPAPETRPPAPARKPPAPEAKPKPAAAAPAARPRGGEEAFRPQVTKPRWWQRAEDPHPDQTLFEAGRDAYARKDYGSAARTLKTLIKRYPESQDRPEAMWLRAEALFEGKDYYHAFFQYEDMLTQYAGSPHYHDALLKEIQVAEIFFGPARRKVLGMPLLSGDTEAVEILRKVYEHQPAGDLADKAVVRIAGYYWDQRQWQSAEDYYDRYCREYPNGESVRVAELRRARCALERCRGPRYDTTGLKLCRDRLEQFRQKYPQMAEQEGVPKMLADLHALEAEALFRVGDYYHRTGQPVAAAHYFEDVMALFADTPWGGKAEAELNTMKGKAGR